MELTGKKILIIVENLPVPFDRRVWQEAKALKKHGANVYIICPKGKGYEESDINIDGIRIFRHPLYFEGKRALGYFLEYFTSLFWEFILSIKIFFRFNFDVIHACNPPDLIFLVAFPYKLLGKKFVFDHHDINPELYLAKFNKKDVFYRLLCFFEKLTFRLSDISIATNESYKEIALARGGKKPEKVFVVRSGPNLENLKIMPPNDSLKKGKNILIGYVGVIGQQEGIDHLLKALNIIIKKHNYSDFHCIICGGGTELEKMKILSNELGLNDYIEFTGRIPDDQLLEILNTADICVNPDIYNEMNDKSTMNKIMEYMALGKPIVQYDLKEGRFSAGEASLYAKPNDIEDFSAKLLELINNQSLRKKMGEFGRLRIEKELQWCFEEEKLIHAYKKLFE